MPRTSFFPSIIPMFLKNVSYKIRLAYNTSTNFECHWEFNLCEKWGACIFDLPWASAACGCTKKLCTGPGVTIVTIVFAAYNTWLGKSSCLSKTQLVPTLLVFLMSSPITIKPVTRVVEVPFWYLFLIVARGYKKRAGALTIAPTPSLAAMLGGNSVPWHCQGRTFYESDQIKLIIKTSLIMYIFFFGCFKNNISRSGPKNFGSLML